MDIKEHSYLTDYFKNRGFDYVEYLGEFLGCRVYRACYNSEDVIAPILTILVKNNRFRNCRDGYEKRVIYDYFEKGKENHSKWQLAAIRIRFFFDKLFFTIIVLLIPDKEYGLMDKIELMRGLEMGEQE